MVLEVVAASTSKTALWSRRRFLGALGMAGGLALATAVAPRARPPRSKSLVRSYVSRPDLRPSNLRILTRADGRGTGSLLLTPNGGTAQSGLMIIGDDGHLVWFKPITGANGFDLKVQSLDGRPVLTWWEGTVSSGHGSGVHVIADETYDEVQRVQAQGGYTADLHDFRLTDRDSALLLAYQPAPFDLTPIGGPRDGAVLDSVVQEIDLADGHLIFQWRGIDHVDIDETCMPFSQLPATNAPFDFLHLNSIEVDRDGDLLVSARNTWTVYKIDRSTGAVKWRLGGKRSDFTSSTDALFAWQHDARRQADGSVSLFDDGADPPVESQSRGLVLLADEIGMAVDVAREYVHPDPLLTGSQGNLQVLPEQNVVVGWGAQPRLTEFTRDGRVLLDAAFPDGSSSYRAFRLPWTGRPSDQPAASVSRSLDGLLVHVSWNGATEVDSWRVLAGSREDHLSSVAQEPKTGFETTITIGGGRPFVGVQALAGDGSVLSTSAPVRI
jgi:Arylsulfotransferase (ASST)